MNRTLGRIALAGFFLSLLVHVLTFAGINVPSRFPYVWGLHIGMFLVWIPFVLLNRTGKTVSVAPIWAQVIVALVFAYAMLNLLLSDSLGGRGGPDIVSGQYVLTSHGRVLAHVTETEYLMYRARELRTFSAVWMMFYVLPGVYPFFWHERSSIFPVGMRVT